MVRRIGCLMVVLTMAVGCGQQRAVALNGAERYKACVNVVDESAGRNRLVIYSFGIPPSLLQKGVIKLDGFILDVYRAGSREPVFSLESGEADPKFFVDFRDFSRGVVKLTESTWDPREPDEEDVPFIETTVMVGRGGKVSSTRRILLQPEGPDAGKIDVLFAKIAAANVAAAEAPDCREAAGNAIAQCLGHLRNMAIANPAPILARLKTLPDMACDGSCQGMKKGCIEEVEAIREILSANRK